MPSVRDDPFFRKPDPNALSNKIMRNLLPQQEHTDRDAAISGLRDLFIAKDTALRAAEKRALTLEQESKRLESQLHELMLNPGRNVSDAHAEANVPAAAAAAAAAPAGYRAAAAGAAGAARAGWLGRGARPGADAQAQGGGGARPATEARPDAMRRPTARRARSLGTLAAGTLLPP